METIFKYSSTKWPITEEFTGDSIKISGKVISTFQFRIRRTTELNNFLSSATTQDVALTRRAIVLQIHSATQNGQSITSGEVVSLFTAFVRRCAGEGPDSKATVEKFASPSADTIVIWAPASIIGQLQAKQDSVPTPLAPDTEITVVTDRATPYTNNIQIDKAVYDKSAYAKPNVDVREGMEAFAQRFQAFEERKKAAQAAHGGNQSEDSDDGW